MALPRFLQDDSSPTTTTNTSCSSNMNANFTKRRRSCRFCPLQSAAPSTFFSVHDAKEDVLSSHPSLSLYPTRATTGSSSALVPPAATRRRRFGAAAAGAARTAASSVVFACSTKDQPSRKPSSRRLRRRAGTGNGGAGPSARVKGVLSRVTKATAVAAAAAAAVDVLASAPAGVGALMTEAQCEGVTLRGTDAELMNSPRSDNSTEAAAAGVDQTIVATQV